jgi:hypothetical protein
MSLALHLEGVQNHDEKTAPDWIRGRFLFVQDKTPF